MKKIKIVVLLLIVVLSFGMLGCDKVEENNNEETLKFTVTYDANGGKIKKTQEIEYNSQYELLIPTRDGYTFVCWKYDGESITSNGTWKIKQDITLIAEWIKNNEETFTITFVQTGEQNVIRVLAKDETLQDVPAPKLKEGYEIKWTMTDSEIKEIKNKNKTVEALETARKFTITYDLGILNTYKYVEKIPMTQEVTYDDEFVLVKPICLPVDEKMDKVPDYTFIEWIIKDSEEELQDGVYKLPHDVTLVAKWRSNWIGPF